MQKSITVLNNIKYFSIFYVDISKKCRLFISTSILLCLSQAIFCQVNFVKGYVISSNKDTLNGLIDYRNWDINPTKLYFKAIQNGNTKIYKPNDIIGFGVNREYYESAFVKMEMSSLNTTDLTTKRELVFKVDSVFLETIIQGEKTLLAYKGTDVREQFYIKNRDSVELLIHKKYLTKTDVQNIVTKNNMYLNQLAVYLQDIPNLQEKLKNVEYSTKSLKELFSYYYQKTETSPQITKKTEKISFEFGFITGVTVFDIKFTGNNFPELINANFPKSINPMVGIFFDIVMPKNQKRWSLHNEVIYSSFKTNGQTSDYVDNDKFTNYNISFDNTYFKVMNLIRYKPLIGKFTIYINAGLSNGWGLSDKSMRTKRTKLFSMDRTEVGNVLEKSRNYEQGYLFGAGAKYKKIMVEIRNEKGNGMSEFINLASNTNRTSFLLGYQF